MATIHAPTEAPLENTAARARRPATAAAATAASVACGAVVLVAGDAAMAGVAALAGHFVDGVAAQWAVAATAIAAAAYAVAGVPQIHLGRRQTTGEAADLRARWGVERLVRAAGGSRVAGLARFVVVSIVAGPLAVGLVAGRRHAPPARAHATTAAAALVFGVSWAGIYLGALAALF